ncbi:hypothetical protein C8R44DRAFT_871002 [Mycena epipterygia]|nr:hypothetical protein C8R44DRAFT_871002 [Mycena epipterygia]
MSASGLEAESDSEGDWEEVQVPEKEKHLEITISARPAQEKKFQLSNFERPLRINCHKLHTLALLTNAWVRNKWINDPLLHARLMSLTPLSLQTAFAMIHKSRVPDQHMRGRMFETAMGRLAYWWSSTFFDVTFEGHIRNRTFDAVQKSMQQRELVPFPDDESWDVELLQEVLDDEGELIRSPNSLMKHALMQKGSRDTSAQLFTALCRGLGIPARLVVSLQSVPWQSIGKLKSNQRKGKAKAEDSADEPAHDPKGKGKGKAKAGSSKFLGTGERLAGGSVPEKSEKAKGKEKAPPAIKLRKTKSKGNVLGAASSSTSQIDPITTPPVFWTEVFSRPDARWIPVDPVRNLVNQAYAFDPSSVQATSAHASSASANLNSAYARLSAGPAPPLLHGRAAKQIPEDNRMLYVLAFEEDGYGRDVTRRYARQFAAKVAKVQGGQKQRGAKEAWWDRVVEGIRRPYRLHRDDVEDAELEAAQLMEGMPMTIGGFKDHPMYVLVRHLTQMQTIHPPPPQTRELGKFRGEPVYPRSAVVSLKTAENWMRSEGRRVKEGEQPMKLVKMRASTIGRMREVEALREGLRIAGEHAEAEAAANGEGEGDGDNLGESSSKQKGKEWENEVMQGLYALSQTEVYVPDPVVDGKIPKNNFGNIDLYVPSMLPAGAVHIPFKGTAKIARKLGFDHAEAVTGFEFKNRRATPIMEGIVIAAENEGAILEAYWEAENEAAERARAKRRDRVLKRWTRLVHGLRIRQSLQEEYKDRQPVIVAGEQGEDVEVLPGLAGGGFVTGADNVVQAYHLPKYQHVNLPFLPSGANSAGPSGAASDNEVVPESVTYDLETMDVDSDPGMDDVQPDPPPTAVRAPKTMQQLAEETTARLRKEFARDDIGEDVDEDVPPPPLPTASAPKAKKARQAKPSRAPSERNPTKTKAKVGAPAARRASAKKRRRNDGTDSDSEEETEPSPAKRAKAGNGAAPPPPARTLRPRRSKTQTELQQEEERELAFRRAIAK